MDPLKIAFFEPWYGGSHQSFLDAWIQRSSHEITVHGLKARHWKWRQEASAWELARGVQGTPPPDVVACSDFVDLPRLLGFLPRAWAERPTLVYFHENQLTYVRAGEPSMERQDFTHGFSNILTAVRADALVFNSDFHRDDFGSAADALLKKLPRPNPRAELKRAIEASHTVPPAPDLASVTLGSGPKAGEPLRIAFPHRLEPDKQPEVFLRAVSRAREASGLAIELVLLGGDPSGASDGTRTAIEAADGYTRHVGYADDRSAYLRWLGQCDVVASTATHEFFGVAFAEAMAAGCRPLAPGRLNYPGLVGRLDGPGAFLFDGEDDLVTCLVDLGRDGVSRATSERERFRRAVLPLDAGACARQLDAVAASLG